MARGVQFRQEEFIAAQDVVRIEATGAGQGREELTTDMAGEVRELTDLVNELIELAAGQLSDEPYVEVSLGDITEDVAARARRRAGRAVTVVADDTLITGRPGALQRAVANLVDNATKFDTEGSEPVTIVVTGSRIAVHDRGPGLTAEECQRIFDRFYRRARLELMR